MPLLNGRLYKDTTTTPHKGISFHEIAKCIGVASGDLGTLASHKNNNKWSWAKPVRSKKKVLPYEEMASEDVSFGFDMTRIFGQGLQMLFNYAKVDKDWIYLRPMGGIDFNPYRVLEDYNGYNHYAKCPYVLAHNPINAVSYAPKAGGYTMPFSIKRNLDAEIQITDLGILTGSNSQQLSSYKYGIAYRNGDNGVVYMALGQSIINAPEEIYVDIKFNEAGTYQLCFVATNEQAGDTTGAALYTLILPKGYMEFTLSYARIPVSFDVSGFLASNINVNTSTGNVVISGTSAFDFWSTFKVEKPTAAGNVGVTGVNAQLTLVFYAYDSDGNEIDIVRIPFDDALSFNPNSNQYDEVTMTESFYTNFSPVLGDTINLGDFGGKVSRISTLKVSFEANTIMTDESNTYIYTVGEPMGGFTINIQ